MIKPIYVEHQAFQRTCTCGNTVVADFSDGITPGISYGENVENLAAYISARQFVPFQLLAEMFRYVFNTPISEGALVKAINRVAKRATPAYELIRKRAETAKDTPASGLSQNIKSKNGI